MSRWPHAFAALLIALPASAFAQSGAAPAASAPRAHAVIDGHALQGAQGRVAVNQASGSGHQQANVAAIAPHGIAVVGLDQRLDASGAARSGGSVRLDGHAFAGSRGAVALNQSAGHANAQANLLAIGARVELSHTIAHVDDAALATVTGAVAPSAGPSAQAAPVSAQLSGDAFRNSQGVVQIHQAAGSGNSASNAVVLRLPGAGP